MKQYNKPVTPVPYYSSLTAKETKGQKDWEGEKAASSLTWRAAVQETQETEENIYFFHSLLHTALSKNSKILAKSKTLALTAPIIVTYICMQGIVCITFILFQFIYGRKNFTLVSLF